MALTADRKDMPVKKTGDVKDLNPEEKLKEWVKTLLFRYKLEQPSRFIKGRDRDSASVILADLFEISDPEEKLKGQKKAAKKELDSKTTKDLSAKVQKLEEMTIKTLSGWCSAKNLGELSIAKILKKLSDTKRHYWGCGLLGLMNAIYNDPVLSKLTLHSDAAKPADQFQKYVTSFMENDSSKNRLASYDFNRETPSKTQTLADWLYQRVCHEYTFLDNANAGVKQAFNTALQDLISRSDQSDKEAIEKEKLDSYMTIIRMHLLTIPKKSNTHLKWFLERTIYEARQAQPDFLADIEITRSYWIPGTSQPPLAAELKKELKESQSLLQSAQAIPERPAAQVQQTSQAQTLAEPTTTVETDFEATPMRARKGSSLYGGSTATTVDTLNAQNAARSQQPKNEMKDEKKLTEPQNKGSLPKKSPDRGTLNPERGSLRPSESTLKQRESKTQRFTITISKGATAPNRPKPGNVLEKVRMYEKATTPMKKNKDAIDARNRARSKTEEKEQTAESQVNAQKTRVVAGKS